MIENHASGLTVKESTQSRGCSLSSLRGRQGPSLGKWKKVRESRGETGEGTRARV